MSSWCSKGNRTSIRSGDDMYPAPCATGRPLTTFFDARTQNFLIPPLEYGSLPYCTVRHQRRYFTRNVT